MCQPFYVSLMLKFLSSIAVYTSASTQQLLKYNSCSGGVLMLGINSFVCKAGKTGYMQR